MEKKIEKTLIDYVVENDRLFSENKALVVENRRLQREIKCLSDGLDFYKKRSGEVKQKIDSFIKKLEQQTAIGPYENKIISEVEGNV